MSTTWQHAAVSRGSVGGCGGGGGGGGGGVCVCVCV